MWGTELLRTERVDGPLPFWFWNGAMKPDEIVFQLAEFAAKGMRGVIIHPRFGLQLPYLSPQWFERVRYAVQRAGELGLEVWLYDEMNWSSGRADNAVVHRRPELAETYLELIRMEQAGPTFTCLVGNDERYFALGGSRILRIIAVPRSGNLLDFTRGRDLTQLGCFGENWFWEVPAGDWSILFFVLRQSRSYVDTLNPAATREFIAVTHERYADAVGDQFGKVVKGFYLDEPAMHYCRICAESSTVPWTENLPGLFRDKYGYDLEQALPDLFYDTGPRSRLVRYHFWSLVSTLYTEGFFSILSDWCHDHNLLLTGHGLAEESLRLQAKVSGNLFTHLRKLDLVGIDDLFHNSSIQKAGVQTRLVALKLASSAAHLGEAGSKPVLCESFGGCGWSAKLADLKCAADLEFAAGVTVLNPHGYHYSLEGDRKRDWPSSQFYHQPWWAAYSTFTQYAAWIGRALSQGRHAAPVAILFPYSAVWSGLEPGNPNDEAAEIEASLNAVTNALASAQWDFDYMCEEDLLRAEVRGGRLALGGEDFQAVVLPSVSRLLPEVLHRLCDFVECGGLVVCCDRLPQEVLVHEPQPADLERLAVLRARSTLVQASGPGKPVDLSATLARILRSVAEPDFALADSFPKVYYLKRRGENGELFFVTNQGADRVETVATLRIETTPLGSESVIFALNPEHGTVAAIAGQAVPVSLPASASGFRQVKVPLCLEQGESIVFLAGPGAQTAEGWRREKPAAEVRTGTSVELAAGVIPVEMTGQNVLPLPVLYLSMRGDTGNRVGASPEEWLVVPGNWEHQVRGEVAYPLTITYRAHFTCRYVPPDLALLRDNFPANATVRVNGQVVEGGLSPSPFDRTILLQRIAGFVHLGKNELRVELPIDSPQQGLRDPLRLCGSFRLERGPGRDGWIIAAPADTLSPGPWSEQGYPFYAGAVTYKLHFAARATHLAQTVSLSLETCDNAATVWVNTQGPYWLPWRPQRLVLDGLLKEGANEIAVTLYNTAQGLWAGFIDCCGLHRACLEFY